MMGHQARQGFTLIELSIVLVIIGLVVGGVLVGQDLIRSAAVRAQLSQIDKYQTAVSTFFGKYNAFPGDMNAAVAAQNGFTPRAGTLGQGDGDGVISAGWGIDAYQFVGEPAMFWVDLTSANGKNLNLVDGSFSTASFTDFPTDLGSTAYGLYLPQAKIGRGAYVYVWSGGYPLMGWTSSDHTNYFGIVGISDFYFGGCAVSGPGDMPATMPLTVKEAQNIDKKIDDGLPQSGSVTAMYAGCYANVWASGGMLSQWGVMDWGASDPTTYGPTTAPTPASANTCYDNGNVTGPQKYSVTTNNGNGVNCALSFQFQQ